MSAIPPPGRPWALVLALALAAGGPARAGAEEDLARAADPELSEPARMQAFEAIISQASSRRALLIEVASDPAADARQRWVAIRALGRSGLPGLGKRLLELCDDPMPAMRAAAASATGDYGGPGAPRKLASMLSDPAAIVRGAAADALVLLHPESAIAALERALDSPVNTYRGQSMWVRRHIVDALAATHSRLALPALLRALGDEDPAVVDAALAGLHEVVGYDFSEGRSRDERIEAWRRWARSEGVTR